MENRSPSYSAKIHRWTKGVTVMLMALLLAASLWLLFTTRFGDQARKNPLAAAREVRSLVHHHRVIAPAVYLTVYVVLGVLGLPIWWLQLFAGIGFGLYEGTFLSVIGSTIGAGVSAVLIRWLAAEWFHQHVESQMERLKKLDETLGHNGFLFVMTVRLIPLIPFGLFNYVLGLSKLSYRDIVLGTFLGAIPLVTLHVALGAGYDPHDWIFDLTMTCLTTLLLSPLALRYLKPKWFEKIGVK